ncbi:glycoside hydrolase family 76 protein [Anaerorudis cellulosivorans]|uniref:glycoside hydrolase family 76 protein n=1 Tax=Anaerorudis cellulosivorans TaxID=3397862 RepID=UPI00221E76D7|nr:glycoside hydrolase family 76 protein [Seramator thermalis]MCW1734355.1 glycosyl hydrolase family 76 [Seramator thermalis]
MVKYYPLLFFFFYSLWCQACADDKLLSETHREYRINWNAAADSSSSALIHLFWNADEHYFNYNNLGLKDFHYWPQAHALDVMIDAYLRTRDNLYKTTINDWYDGVKRKNGNTFFNIFYDDMEWNALAMLRAYQTTGDEKFKTAALEVWEDIKTGWNENAGGGIAWKKDQPYSKNACSNGPASILASRLYQLFGNESDKEWALKIYEWEKETLFNPANGAVYDHIDSRTGYIQKKWIFTYNQGTFLGAALELYKITGEKDYLNDAMKAADYTLTNLIDSNDGLLKDEGNGDGGLFKGIFVRYFTQLILNPDISSVDRTRYVTFLKFNAETLWRYGTDKQRLLFGTYWKTNPGDVTDLPTQLSGCMLIEAAALLEKEEMF